jgi:hypothetical protein
MMAGVSCASRVLGESISRAFWSWEVFRVDKQLVGGHPLKAVSRQYPGMLPRLNE